MRIYSCIIVAFLLGSYHVDAFLSTRLSTKPHLPPRVPIHSSKTNPVCCALRDKRVALKGMSLMDSQIPNKNFTHSDLVWKIRPPPETPIVQRIYWALATTWLRLECILTQNEPPRLLCPQGGKATLEAYYKKKKIGRFGITTTPGPPAPPILETVQDLYGVADDVLVGCGAIIYMFVEPEYRHRQVAALALQVISWIHAIQGCDFTVLVADDDGSGKLVEWYKRNGFSVAPKLQDMFGSPGGKYGITMIAPSLNKPPSNCAIQWWQ